MGLYCPSDFSSIFDFSFSIAITIAIEKRSGKIADQISDQKRSPISGSQSDPGFHFEIDPRLKRRHEQDSTDGAQNRDPISVRKSNPDFQIKIYPRFHFTNRILMLVF
jgi:hypothetical protein